MNFEVQLTEREKNTKTITARGKAFLMRNNCAFRHRQKNEMRNRDKEKVNQPQASDKAKTIFILIQNDGLANVKQCSQMRSAPKDI